MVICESDYGTIIFAKVLKIKPGTGKASESLTIVTLQNMKTSQEFKMLCWNSNYLTGIRLSDRARKLQFGDIITARVIFDIGDEFKCTCQEIKKAGIYRAVREDNVKYIICGKVAKATHGKGVFCLMIPSYSYVDKKENWYQIAFWNNDTAEKEIKTGDFVCIRCLNMLESVHNGFHYRELTGSYYEIAC